MADKIGEMKNPAAGKGSKMKIPASNPVAGTSTGMTARLPSIRAPRDLTLSASSSSPPVKVSLISRPRKNFTPNIPVRREKAEKIEESRSDKAVKRSRERDKREGGRGRGRNKEFVQTAGALFGEGIADIQRRGGYSFGGGGGRGGGGGGRGADAGFINKPVLNLDTVNHIDKEHEDQRLKEILRDDFIDDDLESVLGRDGDLLPVQLPMVDTGRGFKEESHDDSKDTKKTIPPPVAATANLKIKEEPDDSFPMETSDNAQDSKNIKADMKIPMKGGLPVKERPPELSVSQLLTGKHEDFMFFQLPNSLPSLPPEIKQEPGAKPLSSKSSQQQSSAGDSDDESEVEKSKKDYCTLNTLQEGLVATCKVYKSGKTEIWFGDHCLAVNKGTQVGFLQDVVSVEIDDESKTGSMTVLGHIGHRLVCSPDLESLVKQKKT